MTDAEDDATLAAEFVIGTLDPGAAAAAEARVAMDAAFARDVEDWRQRLAPLDDTATPDSPGEGLWPAIAAAITAPAPARAAPRRSALSRWWTSLAAMRATAAGTAAAVVLLAAGLWLALAARPDTPRLIAVLVNDGQAGAIVEAFADGRTILVPLTDMPVPAGKALEVWTLPDPDTGPVSVGLMDRAQTLELRLGPLPEPTTDQLFEITLEPDGGSPTGRPTGPILFVGRTATPL
jgi:anti-sigma-K factor RskA